MLLHLVAILFPTRIYPDVYNVEIHLHPTIAQLFMEVVRRGIPTIARLVFNQLVPCMAQLKVSAGQLLLS